MYTQRFHPVATGALLHDVMVARHHRGNLAMCHNSPDTAHYSFIRVLLLNDSTDYAPFSLDKKDGYVN